MLALLLLLQAPAQAPARLTSFLTQSIGLDTAQLAALERGEPVVKVLDTHDRRDVAIFGVITASKSPADFARAPRDFPAVTIDERDVADMKNCRPGDCVVKLPATDMRRIHDEINWSAPDVQAELSNCAPRRLVEYVGDYRARGDSAMAQYDDRGNLTVHSSEAFAAQLAESPYVYQNLPSLQQYLGSYPRGTLPGASYVLFWSVDAQKQQPQD